MSLSPQHLKAFLKGEFENSSHDGARIISTCSQAVDFIKGAANTLVRQTSRFMKTLNPCLIEYLPLNKHGVASTS
jgi:hypothetical protein